MCRKMVFLFTIMNNSNLKRTFASRLLKWHKGMDRMLPWKADRDPYKIWVSEIILQQTRVDQGTPYYLRFISRFPTLESLANAEEDQLLLIWQGLGYYSRARNMHATAKYIMEELNATFPDHYKDLLKLKGVGPYTAAAISSFAFDEPRAVVDGNVIRVLSRIFAINAPFDSSKGKKIFSNLADELIDLKKPAAFNQAIMDFGALRCTPKNPDCAFCPFDKVCEAKKLNEIESFPVKTKKAKKKERFFHYLVLKDPKNKTLIHKRNNSDIWKGLYEFPLIVSDEEKSKLKLKNDFKKEVSFLTGMNSFILEEEHTFKQSLSHQIIYSKFFIISLKEPIYRLPDEFNLVDYENLCNFAFPKSINRFIEEKLIPL